MRIVSASSGKAALRRNGRRWAGCTTSETKGWSRAVSPLQRSLHATLGCFPDHWQVVLSFACSVASLSLSPSHYLPGRPRLRRGVLADYLFGKGSPSTWCAGRTTVHGAPSATPPFGAQRGITLPRCKRRGRKIGQEVSTVDHCLRFLGRALPRGRAFASATKTTPGQDRTGDLQRVRLTS